MPTISRSVPVLPTEQARISYLLLSELKDTLTKVLQFSVSANHMKYTSTFFPPVKVYRLKKNKKNTHLVFGERKHVTYIWLRRFYFVRNLVAFPVIFVSFIAPSPHRAERGESDVQVAPSEDDFHPHTVAPSWTLRINKRTHSKNVNNSVRSLLETTKPFFGVFSFFPTRAKFKELSSEEARSWTSFIRVSHLPPLISAGAC